MATQTIDAETIDMSFVTTLKMIYQNMTCSGFGTTGSREGNTTMFSLRQCMTYLSGYPPRNASCATPRHSAA